MESNRDEAEKCINLAEKLVQQGNGAKAEKFLRKAERLYPSRKARELLDLIVKMNSENHNHTQNGHVPPSDSGNGATSSSSRAEHEDENSQAGV